MRTLPVILMLSMVCTTAQAEFKTVETEDEVIRSLSSIQRKSGVVITETGNRPSVFQPVPAGKDIKIGEAIKRILPKGWRGYAKDDFDDSKVVSWNTSVSWYSVLESILSASDHAATIDWNDKRILLAGQSVSASRVASAASTCKRLDEYPAPAGLSGGSMDLGEALAALFAGTPLTPHIPRGNWRVMPPSYDAGTVSKVVAKYAAESGLDWSQQDCSVVLRPRPAEAGGTTWTLEAGRPIHVQFANWAATAGWGFSWKPQKSWVVPAGTKFSGSFDKALESAVQMLYEQGKPVRLDLWEGNRYAEIVDVDAK